MRLRAILAVCAFAVVVPAAAQTPADSLPLFATHDVLELRIESNIDELRRMRDEDAEEIEGVLFAARPDGRTDIMPAELKTRGNTRLDRNTCFFPPIRIDVRTRDMEGTVLEGQDKIKLVTHCRQRGEYEQNVIEEYLAYRLYNLITDISFRVRLARITYVDIDGGDDDLTRYGFLIESDEHLAERFGGRILELQAFRPEIYDPSQAIILALFQFMIGNTDWSTYVFHNAELLRISPGLHLPVPYDFDWTGIVDADYARPDPQFRIGSVRQTVPGLLPSGGGHGAAPAALPGRPRGIARHDPGPGGPQRGQQGKDDRLPAGVLRHHRRPRGAPEAHSGPLPGVPR